MLEVQLTIAVSVNERPIWRKTKKVKPDLAGQLPDQLYDKVCWAAENELRRLLTIERTGTKKDKEAETKK